MKRFGWKRAVTVFFSVIALNIALLCLDRAFPDNSAVIIPARILDSPGLPLIFLFGAPMGAGEDYSWDYTVATVVGLFSAFSGPVLRDFSFAVNQEHDLALDFEWQQLTRPSVTVRLFCIGQL